MSRRLRARLAVAAAFAAPFLVSLASLRTGPGWWDTGDLQTVAWIGGIPYPTGFPGYVLLGWAWTHAIAAGEIALRLNALSALAIAAAAATLCALALALEVLPPLAVLGAWLFAFAHPVWERATYADAHPVGFALAFAALALAARPRADARAASLSLLAGGAALAVDNATVLILAGGAVAALGWRVPSRPVLAGCAGSVAIVLCAYAFLPLRSGYVVQHRLDPTLALGIAPGRPYWDDHDPRTREGFRSLVTGSDWRAGDSLARLAQPGTAVAAFSRFEPDLDADLPEGLLVAALLGLGLAAARAPLAVAALALGALLPALFAGSYAAEADVYRYAFALYAVLALGVAVAADRVARAFAGTRPALSSAVVAGLLGIAILHDLDRGRDIIAVRGDGTAAAFAERVTRSTRDDAVVVAEWNFAAPLAYRAYVQHAFGKRVVLCAYPRDHADRYGAWLRTRQVAVASVGRPVIPGFRPRLLSAGYPSLYEVAR